MTTNFFKSTKRNRLLVIIFPVIFFSIGCSTATVQKSYQSHIDAPVQVVSCKVLDENLKSEKTCSLQELSFLKSCKPKGNFKSQNTSEAVLERRLSTFPPTIGLIPLSFISLGIIPTYTVIGDERVSLRAIDTNSEIATWTNEFHLEFGWIYLFKSLLENKNPNNYCDQIK